MFVDETNQISSPGLLCQEELIIIITKEQSNEGCILHYAVPS